VRPADGKPDRPRVAVQEVVRQFAEERLRADAVRWSAAAHAHLGAMTALVRAAEPHMDGPEQATWLDVLSFDHDNIRVAIQRAPSDAALPLVLALTPFWTARGHWTEAHRFVSRALAGALGGADTWGVARLHAALGYFCERLGDVVGASAHAAEALRVGELVGDRDLCARAANTLGDVAASAEDVTSAEGWYTKALASADEGGNRSHRAVALSNLGVLAWQGGRTAEAREHWTAALALAEELGQRRSVAILTGNLGLLDRLDGDLDAAEARFRAGREMAEELADPMPTADAILNLGVVAKDRGDEATARELYMDALAIYERLGYVRYAAVALLHLAMATDELEQARTWTLAARSRAEACGDQLRLGECDSILATLAELEKEMTDR
jgi:tetratricopeptide (TPR) repeat protein